jgi:hypothetical protein
MRHYFTLHHAPTIFVSDWEIGNNGTQSAVTIDGAIIDPQFMRSVPVALLCSSAKQAGGLRHIVENASLITPTLYKTLQNNPRL